MPPRSTPCPSPGGEGNCTQNPIQSWVQRRREEGSHCMAVLLHGPQRSLLPPPYLHPGRTPLPVPGVTPSACSWCRAMARCTASTRYILVVSSFHRKRSASWNWRLSSSTVTYSRGSLPCQGGGGGRTVRGVWGAVGGSLVRARSALTYVSSLCARGGVSFVRVGRD